MKPKPTHADLAGSRYLALQRLARVQKRPTAELLQLYVLDALDERTQTWLLMATEVGNAAERS